MITLSKENLADLSKFIDELPTKYGIPLINFFENLKREQKLEKEEPKEESLKEQKSRKSS